ncbi:PAS domain S-box protein [Chloroflexota bacterium]
MVDHNTVDNEDLTELTALRQRIAELEAENEKLQQQAALLTDTKRVQSSFDEGLFQQLTENMRDGLTIVEDGRIVFMNRQLSEITWYSYSELENKRAFDLAAPEEKDRLQELTIYHRTTGEILLDKLEFWILRKSGERCCIQNSYWASQYDERTYYILTSDITERRLAREALLQSETLYRGVFEGIHEAIFVQSLDGKILDVNSQACTLYGYTYREMLRLSASDFIPPGESSVLDHLKDGAITIEMPLEKANIRANGEVFPVEVSVHIHDIDLEPTLLVVVRDITERKAVEAALRQSEDYRAKVFRTIPDAVAITRLSDGMLLEVNEGFSSIVGYTPEEVVGKTTLDVNIWAEPADRQYFTDQLNRDGAVHNLEITIQGKHDRKLAGLISSRLVELNGEQCLISVFRDISERIQVEKALRQSEDQLAKMFQTIPDSIIVTRLDDGLLLAVNEGFSTVFGYAAEEALGKTTVAINLWSDSADRQYLLDRIQTAGAVRNSEITAQKKDGSKIVGLISSRVIELNDEQCLIAVFHDISERKQAEAALQQLNEELEERVQERTEELEAVNRYLRRLTQMKDEFVSNVSHELRTPITNLKLHQYLLGAQPEKVDYHLDVLQRETDRLARIIEDLLHLSRLDQDAVKMNVKPLDLNALVEQLMADRQRMAQEEGVNLTWTAYPAPLIVMADAGLVGQVMSILVTNALHYTPAGGQIDITVFLRQVESKQWAGFQVQDTGSGVLPEERNHLFDRFYRGSAGQQSAQPGTGLGLALADEIVQRHGGIIEVESSGVPGEGATFTVWLPV